MATPTKKAKVIDKWKLKQWYTVLAPQIFDGREIAEIISSDEDNMKDRIIRVSLADVTGQPSQSAIFTALKFRVTEVKGKNAHTKLIGHELSASYVLTLSRRNRSLIKVIKDIKTVDEQNVRLKILAISGSELSQNTKKNIHHAIHEEVNKIVGEQNFDQLMQDVVLGRLASKIFNRLKQITAMRRVEIRKSEIIEGQK